MRDGMRYGCWPAPAIATTVAPVQRKRESLQTNAAGVCLSVDAF